MTTLTEQLSTTLSGTIERVTFHNPENGYCVLKINARGHKEVTTLVGNTPSVTPGEYVEAEGEWVNDRQFGRQFRAQQLKLIPPNHVAAMEKYLASGIVKGVGAHFAKTLIDAFGTDVFDVIENQPERLANLPGIGKKRREQIISGWNEQQKIRDIMVFLQAHGIGTARAVRIYKTYGDQAIEKVKANPYRLSLDIQGIGFKTADELAQQLGVVKDSPLRAEAGVRHVLQECAGQGHCGVMEAQLIENTAQLLDIPVEIISNAIDAQILAGQLEREHAADGEILMLYNLAQAEKSVATHLRRLQNAPLPWKPIDLSDVLPWVENKTSLHLSDSQREAVNVVVENKVCIVTGGPGVGKTTVVNSILQVVRAGGASVVLCAPTGRAAKRLTESTNIPAKTIHRLLTYDPNTRQFHHDQMDPLIADFVVVDEASMIDIVLMSHLVKAIPSTAALLLVGDVDQLPSVGPGSVLADLIQSQAIPVVRLTEIFRQAKHSQIIINAHRVNHGEAPETKNQTTEESDFYFIPGATPQDIRDKLLHVVTERIPQRFGFDPVQDIQVLTPMHRGDIGVRGLNPDLQSLLNGNAEPKITRFGTTFAPGDKVMQIVNNYDKEVYNGDIGVISKINVGEKELQISYDGKRVEYHFDELDEVVLAYATTIHKSQGSEYPVVVMPVSTAHYAMLQRNLIYTGITRGKKLVVLIGQERALDIAVQNKSAQRRLTCLANRITVTETDSHLPIP